MGSSTTDLFLALLRNALFGTPLDSAGIPAAPDWKGLMALAEKQTLMGLVFDAVSRLPEEAQPPQEIREEMFRRTLRVMQTHPLLDSTLADTVEFYRSHGIRGVLLKGQGIARCYPNPRLRQCGDIDFFVGRKNYRRSVELARREWLKGNRKSSEDQKHFHFNRGSVTVELHRLAALMHTPWRNRAFQRWIESELGDETRLRREDFNGTPVYLPSADFDALFIFYHAWHHFYRSGIGLRQLCDWAMALHSRREEIDRERLGKLLGEFGLLKPWQIFGCIAVDHLGLPEEDMPLYNPGEKPDADMIWKKIMSGGNFGFHEPGRKELGKIPLLKRKLVIIGQVAKAYGNFSRIIPMEAGFYVVRSMLSGGVHTVQQLLAKAQGKDGEGN